MNATRIACLASIMLACSLPAWHEASAGTGVENVVAELDLASYRGILEDLLETHAGDNRGFVWNSSQNVYIPTAGHDVARDNILSWFSGLGLDASLDPFAFGSYVDCNNVLGVLPGRIDPQVVYIIGGHYDSAANPGADDNASGVAGVMEAARILAGVPLACTVIFAAWDGEEKGLQGSHHWVNTQDASVVDGVVNLDMIAYNHNGANNATVYGSAAWRDKWVAAAGLFAPDINIIEYTYDLNGSDHWPFQTAGRPAGGIIEEYPLTNPNYHKQTDSVDTPGYIDYDYAMKLLASGLGLLLQEADLLLPGDADNDKDVDHADYSNLAENFWHFDGGSMGHRRLQCRRPGRCLRLHRAQAELRPGPRPSLDLGLDLDGKRPGAGVGVHPGRGGDVCDIPPQMPGLPGQRLTLMMEIDEQMDGFDKMFDALSEAFPEIPDRWYFDVMLPAFAANTTVLWTRDAQPATGN